MIRAIVAALLLWAGLGAPALADEELSPGVAQLRHVIGSWGVTTEFLNPDGNVACSAEDSYVFE